MNTQQSAVDKWWLDEEQFSAYYRRYHAYTMAKAAKQFPRIQHLIEDIVQTAWMRAWEHRSQFAAQSSFLTWVVTIIFNEALAVLRRGSFIGNEMHEPIEFADGDSIHPVAALDPAFTKIETIEVLRHIRRVTPRDKWPVLVACYYMGFDEAETARLFGYTTSKLKNDLFRTKIAIRQRLRIVKSRRKP